MKVLKQSPTPSDLMTDAGRVILVEREHPYHPFVTWWENLTSGGKNWGHYFADKHSALIDYEMRVARGY